MLGKYARTITPEQHARFLAALHAYSQRLSRRWVEGYRGETLQVTGSSSAEKGGDAIVYSELAGGHLSAPMLMAWRLRLSGAGLKAVDVQFNGAWLGTLRRNDFFSILDQAHGDVDVLIARVNKLPMR